MLDILPLLTDPGSFGGDPADAFDVVVPSLPGYGFSDRPAYPGMTSRQISALLVQLMQGLRYEQFAAHGYDIGASILGHLCLDFPHHLIGYHTTEPANAAPYLGPGAPPLSEAERAYVEYQQQWEQEEGGYDHIQRTRPQTLAYGLNDSPGGLVAWIIEKWYVWTDPPTGDLHHHFTRDQLFLGTGSYAQAAAAITTTHAKQSTPATAKMPSSTLTGAQNFNQKLLALAATYTAPFQATTHTATPQTVKPMTTTLIPPSPFQRS